MSAPTIPTTEQVGGHTDGTVMILGGGNPPLVILNRGHGVTPECPQAKFKRGNVVRVRNLKWLANTPKHAAVFCVVPPGFSPDDAYADALGKPRPVMSQVGSAAIKYIIVGSYGNGRPWLVPERVLIATDEPDVEIVMGGAS
jgi:hypothetical protein